jgi:ATP-dependent RNA helicase DeaD
MTEPQNQEAPPETSAQTFEDLKLPEVLLSSLSQVGYEAPSPIQARTIPPLLEGRDVLGQAQTGTGKTAAFALPVLAGIDLDRLEPQALVLTPTRELAIQVAEAFQKYASRLDSFHVLPIYGGQAYPIQLRPLKRGVHVIVATPGRLMDHLKRGSVDLSALKWLVLDEADEMLNMGFLEDVEWILEHIPQERQTALFSATMPPAIKRIAERFMRDPEHVRFQRRVSAADTIRQRFQVVPRQNKLEALTRFLEVEVFDAMIIFVRTKIETTELSGKLEARGYASAPLNGDMAQNHREQTVERLRTEKLDIVVATDVAARGLDVQRISHVINYDMPTDTEAYVHRIGRTGRAGRTGNAVLFVTPREKRMLRTIERNTDTPIERLVLPTTKEVNLQRIERFKERITDALQDESLSIFTKLVKDYIGEKDLDAETVAGALALMSQGDQPLLLAESEEPQRDYDFESERSERRPKAHPMERPTEPGMDRYRIEVGYRHGVQPGSIVGAVANEAGIDGREIGRIEIYDFFSTVDLPERMPRDIFEQLSRTRVCNQELRLSRMMGTRGGYGARGSARRGRGRRSRGRRGPRRS